MNTLPRAKLLRLSLKGNALFSFTSGLILFIAHKPIASFIGLDQSVLLIVTGLSLVVFAAGLLISSNRESPEPLEAKIAVGLDLAWILVSILIVSLGNFSKGGNWATIIVADIVLVFAALQFFGLLRLGRDEQRDSI